jgi:hypothetical protein
VCGVTQRGVGVGDGDARCGEFDVPVDAHIYTVSRMGELW